MTVVIDTRAAHSEWGGSVAYRVKNCVGSVALNRTVPARRRASLDALADEGTWAHALAAYCLQQGYEAANAFINAPLPAGVEVPPQYVGQICGAELVDAVNQYLTAVFEELALSDDAELFVETDVEFGVEGVFGRCDAVVWHPSLGRLRGFDYKHGAGLVVDVDDSDQAQFYLYSMLRAHPEWQVLEAVLTIVQPRPWKVAAGILEAVKDQTIHPADLVLWADEYTDAIERSKVALEALPGAHMPAWASGFLKAGPWCDKTFCDAMAVCPAQETRALAAVQSGFKGVILDMADVTTVDLALPAELDLERLEKMAAAAGLLAAYAQKCEDYLFGLAMNGHALTLHKVVDKIGRRKYVASDEEVVGFVDVMFGVPADVATRTQLQTLTEMKKILKQHGAKPADLEDFELRFTLKESSGHTLAPISDKRPAVVLVEKAFGSVNLPTA